MWRRATVLPALALVLAACGTDAGTTTTAAPASEPSAASPSELPIEESVELDAGSYALAGFPVAITFEIPADWFSCSPSAVEQAVCHESGPQQVEAVTFQIVDNVVADPCSDQETAELLDPPVGPSVDDLVTAISSLETFEATTPEAITVSGFPGVEFTLTASETEECGATWATTDRTTGMGPGETNLLRVVDVDGTRVLIAGAYQPGTGDAEVAAVTQIMDSVEIEP